MFLLLFPLGYPQTSLALEVNGTRLRFFWRRGYRTRLEHRECYEPFLWETGLFLADPNSDV